MSHLLHFESTKEDGNLSPRLESKEYVLPRQEKFLAKFGFNPSDCVFIETEHEDKVTHVTSADKGGSFITEALVTNEKGVMLYLLTADCFPVTFYDPVKSVIALAHLGWKPTSKQLVLKVIEEMKNQYGCVAEDLQIIIGPGIHKESYRFVDPIQKQTPGWAPFVHDLPSGETEVDVLAYILKQLADSGVKEEKIKISPIDTATSDNHFSYYRDVRKGKDEGRFATVVGMVSNSHP